MKKCLLAFVLSFVVIHIAMADTVVVHRSVNLTMFENRTSAYDGVKHEISFPSNVFTYTVDIKGNPSVVNVAVQGAIKDGTGICGRWDNFGQYSGLNLKSTTKHISGKPLDCVRGKVYSFTNGTSITIRTKHIGN